MEYKESSDKKHAAEEFLDISESTNTPRFIVVGQILNNAFSQDPSGWQEIFDLVIHLYMEAKLFEGKDLVESVNVSMANFLDMLIDYPNSKDYAFGVFEKLNEMELLSADLVSKYKQHVENLQNVDYDY